MSGLDFAALDPSGRLILAVEAKRTFNGSDAWAAGWRNNLLEDAPASLSACTHMLVTPDHIFVWKVGAPRGAAPDEQLDAAHHLGPYFQRLGIPASDIEPRAFESLVGWWLRDLAAQPSTSEAGSASRDRLPAGVRDVLTGTRIVQEAAA